MRQLASLVLANLLLCGTVRGQEPSLHFKRFGQTEGLSQVTVQAITQDSLGFVWVGTQDGLNRFDGYAFHAYVGAVGRSKGLDNDYILSLLTDRQGVLWVGTFEGLFRYDPRQDRFVPVRRRAVEDPEAGGAPARSVFEDSGGNLWVGFQDGLVRMDGAQGTFTSYVPGGADPDDPETAVVTAIAEDGRGNLWIGTRDGLWQMDPAREILRPAADLIGVAGADIRAVYADSAGRVWIGSMGGGLIRFDPADDSVVRFVHRPGDGRSIGNDGVTSIHEDASGRLWVGTMDGVNLLDPADGGFSIHRHDDTPYSLSQSSVLAVFGDRSGLIWIGTLGGGLNQFDPAAAAFRHIRHRGGDQTSLPHDMVYALLMDREDVLWVGSLEGGLSRYDPLAERFVSSRHDPADPRTLSSNHITAVVEGDDDILWVGTNADGLNAFHRRTGVVRRYRHDPDDESALPNDRIRALARDTSGAIWVGTSGGGLSRLDPETGRFTHYRSARSDAATLSSDYVRSLLVDSRGRLWVGTYGNGLNLYHRASDGFTRFVHDASDAGSISSPYVRSIFEDHAGVIWAATDDGLNRLDEATGTFTVLTEEDGLPNNLVYGVEEDDAGRLWLSTNNGLSRFSPAEGSFMNFGEEDGIQGREFNTGAFFQDASGQMYFGGVNGLTIFHPDSIRLGTAPPEVVITDFNLFDAPVVPSDTGRLRQSIGYTSSLTLGPSDRVFSFEFTALDYRASDKTRYWYRLEGFDDQWIETDPRDRDATFTNIAPGDYTFRVTASVGNGARREPGASLAITVLPPFWRTLWFRGLILVVVGGTLGGVVLWRDADMKRQNALLDAMVRARTRELQERSAELQHHVEELQESLRHIDRLEGLLPICSNCKNIKAEDGANGAPGTWLPIENYVMERSHAVFSHGICPECQKKLYPGV